MEATTYSVVAGAKVQTADFLNDARRQGGEDEEVDGMQRDAEP